MDKETFNKLDKLWYEFREFLRNISEQEKKEGKPFGCVYAILYEPPDKKGSVASAITYTGTQPDCYIASQLLADAINEEFAQILAKLPLEDKTQMTQEILHNLELAKRSKVAEDDFL